MNRLGPRRVVSSCSCGVDHGRMLACDAVGLSDPTGTFPRRRALARELDERWRMVRQAVAAQIGRGDILALSPATTTSQLFSAGADRLQTGQTWFDSVLSQYVLGNDRGEWLAESVRSAYAEGARRAARLLRRPLGMSYERSTTHGAAAVIELQGVMEAVSQQAMRVLSTAVSSRQGPFTAAREVSRVVESTGVLRGKMVASVEVVRAFNGGILDGLEAGGTRRVGLVPEHVLPSQTGDAKKTRTPRMSPYRQGKAERTEKKLGELQRVNVATAGDLKVCPRCEAIAEDGPYDIDEARGLIPAHPSCRCAFEPVEN